MTKRDPWWQRPSSLLIALTMGTAPACSRPPPAQVWKSPSGRSYRVLAVGPIQGQGWSGLVVKYDAPSEDPQILRENADDLKDAVSRLAEQKQMESIIVTADYAPEGRSGIYTSRGYNDVYQRAKDGSWQHVAPK